MKRVSVIGTVHKDSGLANASALLAILEHLRPEAIFLEAPEAAFDDFFSGTGRSLESTAVSRYRQIHQVALVPVDLPTPQVEFFSDNEALYKAIERQSPDYRRLLSTHSHYVRTYGFDYLNSRHCTTLWSDVHEATLSAIQALADGRLAELYKLWRSANDLRDKGMMKNIEAYCQHNASANGVFLVGSAHRQSIYDKSRKHSASGPSAIHWEFPVLMAGGIEVEAHRPSSP